MARPIYFDDFENWGDVSSNFTEHKWDQDVQETIPEPEEVIYASYSAGSYEGEAFVLYRNGEVYSIVEGSHCSCYGLEGQWTPEDYTLEVLIGALEKRWSGGDCFPDKIRDIIVAELKERHLAAA